jgi:hypothetical protein
MTAKDWTTGIRLPVGAGIFLFAITSRSTLGPTQAPMKWVPGALSLEVKLPGHETDHTPPCSAEVKDEWNCTCNPPCVFMAGA